MMTQLLGFENFGDEYKLMGLSSYGQPTYKEVMLNTLFEDSKIFKLNKDVAIKHALKEFKIFLDRKKKTITLKIPKIAE